MWTVQAAKAKKRKEIRDVERRAQLKPLSDLKYNYEETCAWGLYTKRHQIKNHCMCHMSSIVAAVKNLKISQQ